MKRLRRPQLNLELLENRIVPTTWTRLPNTDGYATDYQFDGVFDTLNTSSTTLQSRYYQGVAGQAEDRTMVEFYIGDLGTNIQILSARLTGNVTVAGQGGGGAATVNFYGYTGNGIVALADATAPATQIGQLTNYSATGPFSVTLDTQFIQLQLSSPYLGIRIATPPDNIFFIDSRENLSTPQIWPTLVIEYNLSGNNAPTAVNDSYSVNEDTLLSVPTATGLLVNDSDPDGNALTASVVSGPAHGTLILNSNGSFSYWANANYSGSDSFTYRVNDGLIYSNVATVALTINPVNDAPVANDNTYNIIQDYVLGVVAPGVLGNDTDVEGSALTASLFTGPVHGSLTFNSNGSFVYSPTPGYYGTDTFTYRAYDGQLYSNAGWVTINIQSSNRAPTANNDSYSVNEDNVLSVAASGVIANDTDADNNPLTASLVSGVANGTLVFNANGSFTYTPNANYNGSDSFTYKVYDGQAYSNVATVSLTVNSVNDVPVAVDDSFSLNEDNTLTVSVPGLLSNDTDVEGSTLSTVLVAGPSKGTLTLNSNGTFTYIPNANYYGSDSFTYKANDGSADSNVATVTLTINSVNDAPVAANDSYLVAEDGTLGISAPGVLSNDTDVEGDTLTAVLVSGPSHGTLTLNANGSFTYTPNANYNGLDSFTYKANDGTSNSNVATVSLTVNSVNDAPVAANDSYTLNEDATLTVPLSGVTTLTMTSDPGDYVGQGRTYSFTTTTGTFTANRNYDNGVSLSYQDTASFSVWWYLNFAAPNDATLTPGVYANATRWPFQAAGVPGLSVYGEGRGSNTLTGQFTVVQAVYAADGTVLRFDATFEQHSEGFTPALRGEIKYVAGTGQSGVLFNDTDVEGDTLSSILVSGPSHGTVTLNSDGTFSYTPNANYNGTDSFTYKANDGSADSNVATVSLTVNAVNDAPVAANDSYIVAEDGTLGVSAPGVLSNDSDVDGDALTAVLVTGPSHGTLTLNANGSFTYTPNANYNGPDSFTYKASDGSLNSNVATVSLTITPVNDAPVANAGADGTNVEGSLYTFNGTGSSDIDGDTLTYSWNFGDGNTATGATVNYAHRDQGTYTVTLTVSDGVESRTDTMILAVSNAAPTATLGGPGTGVRGQARTFTLGADDPSPVDDASDFTYTINWGDGNTQTVSGPIGSQVDHVFTDTGTYTVSITATDKDSAVSSAVQQTITISAVEMQGGDLAIGGTTGDDNITLKPANAQGGLALTLNGVNQGTFTPTGQLLIFGQAGRENIKFSTVKFSGVAYYVQNPAVILGGDGNDTIDARGSSSNNVLVGGAGNDLIYGGLGRDILLGGAGVDTLRGGQGEDLLIGNSTIYDGDLTALLSLMAEWGRTDADYATRANHLQGGSGGLNGSTVLDATTILDDSAIDQLYGEGGLDLFFTTSSGTYKDKLNDLTTGELNVGL